MQPLNICIVTPDIVGPIRNGGIGTASYFQAIALAEAGHQVTLVFAETVLEVGTFEHWQQFYRAKGIHFVPVSHLLSPLGNEVFFNFKWLQISLHIQRWLQERAFDVIHFQDWRAAGFHTIQAKRTGQGFAQTHLALTMHSSHQWIAQGMRCWNEEPFEHTMLMWAERYCCEHVDTLLSPSNYMFDWALRNHWKLSPQRQVIPYCHIASSIATTQAPIDRQHVAFFGRMETRKGFEPFCDAIRIALAERPGCIRKLSFVGKPGALIGRVSTPLDYASKALYGLGIEVSTHTEFDTFEALSYLKKTGAVAVIPSLVDNLPLTVIECIEHSIPFIASDCGGVPEMADPRVLFSVAPAPMGRLLSHLNDIPFESMQHPYSSQRARVAHLHFHAQFPRSSAAIEPPENPLVSVCVPYFNYGHLLPQLIDSLQRSTYANFEVILVDDGSTDPHSMQVFQQLKDQLQGEQFRFFSHSNQGIGHTRNAAASRARGEYLVFMDSDNTAKPDMLERFVQGMQASGADCLTCHADGFIGNDEPGLHTTIQRLYLPVGACLEVGMLENVFGDANFIVKRSIFEAMGGFTLDRDSSWEDFEFLARLNLAGRSQDVVPASLFWYRITDEGFSRNTSQYLNRQRVLRAYTDALPDWLRFHLAGFALPAYLQGNSERNGLIDLYDVGIHLADTHPEAARKIAVKLVDRLPDGGLGEYIHAVASYRLDDFEDAVHWFQTVFLALPEPSVDMYMRYCVSLLKCKDMDTALQVALEFQEERSTTASPQERAWFSRLVESIQRTHRNSTPTARHRRSSQGAQSRRQPPPDARR